MNKSLLADPSLLSFFINESVYIINEKVKTQILDGEVKIIEKIFIKDFLIYLNENDFINEESLKIFLEKILQAVNVSLTDVEILALDEFNLETIKESNVKHCILFDGSTTSNLIKYKIESSNNLKYLFVDDLNKINSDINLKKQLWSSLKEMFIK